MGRFEQLRQKNILETKQKLKEAVHFDDIVIQLICLINDSKKVSNILVKRLRELYELYNPEFSRKITDQEVFVRLIHENNDRKEKGSMGADLDKKDLDAMKRLADELNLINDITKQHEDYLRELMETHCPNINAVAGYLIGAKLIELAGGLKALVMFPSSTVQILGAEKALFRHLKTNARMPKHGVIVQHPFLANAPDNEKGKRARAFADKVLLAAKLDYFKGKYMGDQLRNEMEDKFR